MDAALKLCKDSVYHGWTKFDRQEHKFRGCIFWNQPSNGPAGTCWLMLGKELYSWNKANMSINNIILGTYWLDWYGSITINNHTTGTSQRNPNRHITTCQ